MPSPDSPPPNRPNAAELVERLRTLVGQVPSFKLSAGQSDMIALPVHAAIQLLSAPEAPAGEQEQRQGYD